MKHAIVTLVAERRGRRQRVQTIARWDRQGDDFNRAWGFLTREGFVVLLESAEVVDGEEPAGRR